MRLWPTTPLLSRETLAELELRGERVPAGTQVLIVNTFNHRDRDRLAYADRFAPEEWIDGDAGELGLQPLQPRPAGLPRHRDRDRRRRAPRRASRQLELADASPGSTPRSLPHMLDFFGIGVRLEPQRAA